MLHARLRTGSDGPGRILLAAILYQSNVVIMTYIVFRATTVNFYARSVRGKIRKSVNDFTNNERNEATGAHGGRVVDDRTAVVIVLVSCTRYRRLEWASENRRRRGIRIGILTRRRVVPSKRHPAVYARHLSLHRTSVRQVWKTHAGRARISHIV